MQMIRQALKLTGCVTALMLGAIQFGIGAQDYPAPPPACSFLIRDIAGRILVESEASFSSPWTVYWSLSVDPYLPEHKVVPFDGECPAPDPDAEEVYALSEFGKVLRRADCTVKCAYPLLPEWDWYFGRFSNGNEVALQLPSGTPVGKATALSQGETISLDRWSAGQAAAWQYSGIGFGIDEEQIDPFSLVGIAECASLAAFESKDAALRREALLLAGNVMQRLLKLYQETNGGYPGQLCQIFVGDTSVCRRKLHNPYRFEQDFCETQYATPRAAGYLLYFPEFTAESGASGYWLGVVGDGKAMPSVPLPDSVGAPQRAIAWLEAH